MGLGESHSSEMNIARRLRKDRILLAKDGWDDRVKIGGQELICANVLDPYDRPQVDRLPVGSKLLTGIRVDGTPAARTHKK